MLWMRESGWVMVSRKGASGQPESKVNGISKPEGSGALVWSCCSGWKKFDGSNANL
jgi:hypothetical protein